MSGGPGAEAHAEPLRSAVRFVAAWPEPAVLAWGAPTQWWPNRAMEPFARGAAWPPPELAALVERAQVAPAAGPVSFAGGDERWFDATASPLGGGVFVTLRPADHRLTEAMALAGFGVFEWSAARGVATMRNHRASEILGRDPAVGPMTQTEWREMLHPEGLGERERDLFVGSAGGALGYAAPEDLQRSEAAGFDGHLAKPPEWGGLMAEIRRAPRRG